MSKEQRSQFVSEISAISHLHHPNVVQVFGYIPQGSKENAGSGVIHEFVEESSLSFVLNEKQLTFLDKVVIPLVFQSVNTCCNYMIKE